MLALTRERQGGRTWRDGCLQDKNKSMHEIVALLQRAD